MFHRKALLSLGICLLLVTSVFAASREELKELQLAVWQNHVLTPQQNLLLKEHPEILDRVEAAGDRSGWTPRRGELDETILYETFENGIPEHWIVVDGSDDGYTWRRNFGTRIIEGFDSEFAIVDSDNMGQVDLDEQLISPVFDCSDLETVYLSFSSFFWYYDEEVCDVDVTVDGGDTWVNVLEFYLEDSEDNINNLDISEEAAGNSEVQIRFRYYDANYAYFWVVDNVLVHSEEDEAPSGTANLSGTVTDSETGAALEGVVVTIGSHSATTDDRGGYSIEGCVIGQNSVEIPSASGYYAYAEAIELSDGFNTVNVELDPWPEEGMHYFEVIEYSWQAVSENATDLELGDDASVLLTFADYGLGDFTWYDAAYRDMYVNSNGRISFTNSDAVGYPYSNPTPNEFEPNSLLSIFGADLNPADEGADGAVYAEVVDGKLVITWSEVVYYNTDDTENTFQCVMDFDTREIVVNYNTISAHPEDAIVAIGYEDQDGEIGLQVYYGVDDNMPILDGEVSGRIYYDWTTGSISGTVMDADGDAIENATVSLTPQGGLPLMVFTDEEGHYRFGSLSPGTYSVSAEYDGYVTGTQEGIEVEAGDFIVVDFNLTTGTNASLSGTIQDEATHPLMQINVSLTPETGFPFVTTSDGSGHYELLDLTPGTYSLRAEYDGYDPYVQDGIELVTGQAEVINITMIWSTTANVSGVITDDDGNALGGVTVTMTPNTGDTRTTTSDAHGYYEIADIVPEIYSLSTDFAGYIPYTQNGIDLSAGDIETIDITLSAYTTGNISGTIIDSDDNPMENVLVAIQPDEGLLQTVYTDRLGYYEFDELAPATYDLVAVIEDYAPYIQAGIEVEAGDFEVIDITLALIVTYSIENIQTSVEAGTWVTTTGTVTLPTNSIHTDRFDCYIQDESGYGVMLYDSEAIDPADNLNRGDQIQVTGQVVEYNGITELVYFEYEVLSTGNDLPTPYTGTTATIAGQQALEGAWAEILGQLESDPETGSYALSIDDGSGAVQVYINEAADLDLSDFAEDDWIVIRGPIGLYNNVVQIIPSMAEDFNAPILEAPASMSATREDGSPSVELSWTFTGDDETYTFDEFIIFRNGDALAEVDTIGFIDDLTGEAVGAYSYYVVASFVEGNSANSDTASVNWDGVGVNENLFSTVPTEYSIARAYPNPFNPTMTAVIGLPDAAELNVRVFNILGEQVSVLAQGRFAQGYHAFTFDATNLSSGIYFIRAHVPGKMNTVRKITLVR